MKITRIKLTKSIPCRFDKEKANSLYSVDFQDERSSETRKWASWELDLVDGWVVATPPNKFESTRIPPHQIEFVCVVPPAPPVEKKKVSVG